MFENGCLVLLLVPVAYQAERNPVRVRADQPSGFLSPRARPMRRRTPAKSCRTSCSQTRITLQPRRLSNRSTCLSRCRFRRILAAQNALFVFGIVPCWGQPCQKQPSTNTAILRRRKAKSGVPGRPVPALMRFRRPARRSAVRRTASGAVPLRLTRAMRRLRSRVVFRRGNFGAR